MTFLFNALKYSLKNILLFWCPFGRSGAKEFCYFYGTMLSSFLSTLVLFVILNHWFPDSELLRLFTCAAGWIAAHQVIMILFLFFAIESAAIRRGHDLGYGAFYTVTHFIRGTEFIRELLSQPGKPYANEYGPAPEKTRSS